MTGFVQRSEEKRQQGKKLILHFDVLLKEKQRHKRFLNRIWTCKTYASCKIFARKQRQKKKTKWKKGEGKEKKSRNLGIFLEFFTRSPASRRSVHDNHGSPVPLHATREQKLDSITSVPTHSTDLPRSIETGQGYVHRPYVTFYAANPPTYYPFGHPAGSTHSCTRCSSRRALIQIGTQATIRDRIWATFGQIMTD
ncbi:hypothetical protein WN51_01557 [Melipona quadrifasciata]|uniref:Uncharacterized protein n=1 Tax=Melipona quadrifasciata TaxID=166423 RepID=A0A0M8ZWP0_9HYME|nr:hypothetical protein WN51_01557 [Melipona quadrifasciata]